MSGRVDFAVFASLAMLLIVCLVVVAGTGIGRWVERRRSPPLPKPNPDPRSSVENFKRVCDTGHRRESGKVINFRRSL